MADVEFAELTQTVTTLPYEQKRMLINVLEHSLHEGDTEKQDPRICAVNKIFGMLSHEEAEDIRSHRVHIGERF